MRSGPGTTFGVTSALAFNQTVTATGRNAQGGWLAIRTPDGKTGWAAANFLNCTPAPDALPVATAGTSP